MTVAQAISHPVASVIMLAEITAGVWCRAWVVDGTYASTYALTFGDEVVAVRWNRETILTEQTSVADVDNNGGSWYWDRATGTLYVRPPGGVGSVSTTSLVAHWRLEETGTGFRLDAHNSYDLAANGGIPNAVGAIDNCVDFGAINYYLFLADSAFNFKDTDFCFTGIVNFAALTAGSPVLFLGNVTNWAAMLYTDGTNLIFSVSSDGTTWATSVTSTVALSTGTWYQFRVYHDSVNDLVGIQVSNEAVQTAAHSAGTFDLTSSADFNIGVRWDTSAYINGKVDSVSVFSSTLSTSENSLLYNGGAFKDYPFDGGVPPEDIFANVVTATAKFFFSNPVPKTLNDRFYDPRLLSAPALSQRIEAMFGDVAQIGGGSLTLANVDGYFDDKLEWQWNAGAVVLKIGVDLPNGAMAWADYETAATWAIEDWSRGDDTFELRLTESKSRLKTKLPFQFFTREDYPNIEEASKGTPIQIIYGRVFGAPATLIDPGSRRFKVAGHAVKELSEVRIKKIFDEAKTRTIGAGSWRLYATDVYRYFLEDEEGNAVTYDGTAIPKADDLDDCIATANTWWDEENFIYVHPASGNTISSGTYVIQSTKQIEAWDNINFASRDLANGEFTLGDDWSTGQEVSIDLNGKTSGGVLIENSIDIIEDILTTVGATNLNAASFTSAAARLLIGTTITNRPKYVRSVGLILKDPEAVLDIINEILAQIGAFLYSNELGEYTIGLFEPQPGESLALIDDLQSLSFAELNETKDIVSAINSTFAERKQDGWSQNLITENTAIQYANEQAEAVFKIAELGFTSERDVRDYNERTLVHQGTPQRLLSIKTPWTQWLRVTGEQVRIYSARYGLDEITEVIERRVDVGSKSVQLRVGNLRGWSDKPGFWVGDSDVLPDRFATHAGYGSGSLVWNSAWSAEIKTWARQNVGYWTDDNCFADPTDPDSFIPSSWI